MGKPSPSIKMLARAPLMRMGYSAMPSQRFPTTHLTQRTYCGKPELVSTKRLGRNAVFALVQAPVTFLFVTLAYFFRFLMNFKYPDYRTSIDYELMDGLKKSRKLASESMGQLWREEISKPFYRLGLEPPLSIADSDLNFEEAYNYRHNILGLLRDLEVDLKTIQMYPSPFQTWELAVAETLPSGLAQALIKEMRNRQNDIDLKTFVAESFLYSTICEYISKQDPNKLPEPVMKWITDLGLEALKHVLVAENVKFFNQPIHFTNLKTAYLGAEVGTAVNFYSHARSLLFEAYSGNQEIINEFGRLQKIINNFDSYNRLFPKEMRYDLWKTLEQSLLQQN